MSDNLTMLIHDVATGEIIERELNDDELAEHEEMLAADLARQAEAEAKAAARLSALAKLADLGLTEEELGAL